MKHLIVNKIFILSNNYVNNIFNIAVAEILIIL